jgi:PAS domain S-box-containing protein
VSIGFIANLLIVLFTGLIFFYRTNGQPDNSMSKTLDMTGISLIGVSFVLLIVVYFIIRSQLKEKLLSQAELSENKHLLQSIIDNSSNPIFVKKLNGEYLFINKPYEKLYSMSNEAIKGKTDSDFLPLEQASNYRNSDMEVAKVGREIKVEEEYQQEDGPHTYIATKFPLFDNNGRVYAIGGISTDITDIKETEQSLKDGETFFRLSTDPLIIASENSFLKVNPATLKTLGYTEEELLGKPFMSFVHHDDVAKTIQEVSKLQRGATTINFENRYQCKDGSFKWLNWNTYPDPSTGLLYAVARDVTVQKDYEETLKASNNFFKMSIDILVVATGEKFEIFNPALVKTLGYSETELKERTFFQFIHPDDLEITQKEIQKLKTGVSTINFECRWVCKDGSIKWLSWTASPDISNGHLYAVAHDVTEFKKDRESLIMADRFFNMSFDMLIVSNAEYFIKVNAAFTRILGYDQKDMADKPFLQFAHPDDAKASIEAVEQLTKGESVVNHRARAKCKDGSYKWLEWTSTIDKKTGLIYAVARDITKRVELENERTEAVNELLENEEKLKLILENINEGVIVTDPDRKVVLANYMANELMGIEEDEKISANLTDQFELYYPDEKTVFPSQNLPLDKALMGESTNDVDVILWKPDVQQKKRVLLSGRPLVDPENNVVAAVLTIKDISKYKQLEEELKETELKYRRLIGFKKDNIDDIPDARLTANKDNKLPH